MLRKKDQGERALIRKGGAGPAETWLTAMGDGRRGLTDRLQMPFAIQQDPPSAPIHAPYIDTASPGFLGSGIVPRRKG